MDLRVQALAGRIRDANEAKRKLRVRGGGTKDFYGEMPAPQAMEVLDTRTLVGNAKHEPSELVVTAPAGMPLATLEALLAESGQCLAFEPPRFSAGGTVGGMVAAGLSGPSRAATGALRDHVLGLSLLSGTGELMHFGGRVIKNVAGYDVSRLVAGSLGILGVIVEVSLKALPKASAEATLRFEMKTADALEQLHAWGARPLPLDASACCNGELVVRLRGAPAAVHEAAMSLGGERVDAAAAAPFWQGLRDHTDAFFTTAADAVTHNGATLWRLSLPQSAPLTGLAGDELIEWHGGQRWLVTTLPAPQVRAAAVALHGHATIFRSADKSAGVFAPLPATLAQIHRRLKQAFDPNGVLNPGRLYADL